MEQAPKFAEQPSLPLDLDRSLAPGEILRRLRSGDAELVAQLAVDYAPTITALAQKRSRQPDEISRLVAAGNQAFYQAATGFADHFNDHLLTAIRQSMSGNQPERVATDKVESEKSADIFWSNGHPYRYNDPEDFLYFMKHNFMAVRGVGEYYADIVQLLFGLHGAPASVGEVSKSYDIPENLVCGRLACALRGIETSMRQFGFEIRTQPLHKLIRDRPELDIYLSQLEQGAVGLRRKAAVGAGISPEKLLDLQRQCGLAAEFPMDLSALERRIHRKLVILDNFTTLLKAAGHPLPTEAQTETARDPSGNGA